MTHDELQVLFDSGAQRSKAVWGLDCWETLGGDVRNYHVILRFFV